MFRLKRKTSADDIVNLVNNKLDKVFENTTNKLNSNFKIMSENGKLKDKINRLEQELQAQITEFKLKLKDKDNLIEKQSLELLMAKKEVCETNKKYTRFVNATSELIKLIIPPNEEVAKKMKNFISKCTKITHLPPTGPKNGQAIGSKSSVRSASRSRIIKGVKECN